MMEIRPIRNDADLIAALAEVDQLIEGDPELGTPAGDKLDILATLIEAYESKNYPVDKPDPIEAIKFRMEQGGLGITDLVPLIGNSNRVYEVLNGKRPLTLRMIRNLNRELGIPATALIA
jgi:HTH-type transcriptional regulator/antitoxin HigA